MARSIRKIAVSAVDGTGKVIGNGRRLTLHGWALTEVNNAAGSLQFRTAAPSQQGNDAEVTAASPVEMTRTLAADTDLPVVFDHEGWDMPGGLAITCTSTSKVTGWIFVS